MCYILLIEISSLQEQRYSKMNKNLLEIKENLNGKAELIAVSKYRKKEEILTLYNAGQRIFAENRVQSLLERAHDLPNDIEWHLIGHLQRNKVKSIIPHVSLIHSIDSLRLINEVQKESKKIDKVTSILLQIHVAKEDSKFGFKPMELTTLLQSLDFDDYPNIQFQGIMSMATNTPDKSIIREEFKTTKRLFENIKETFFRNNSQFKDLSMGMSSDYKIALEEGSTMVRIGSLLFK